MKTTYSRVAALLLTTGLASWNALAATEPEASVVSVAGEQIEEIMPGMLKGYLSKEEQLDSKAFVLPAPAEESARQAMDTAWAEQMLKLQDTPRYELATRDADLAFPAAASTLLLRPGHPGE